MGPLQDIMFFLQYVACYIFIARLMHMFIYIYISFVHLSNCIFYILFLIAN